MTMLLDLTRRSSRPKGMSCVGLDASRRPGIARKATIFCGQRCMNVITSQSTADAIQIRRIVLEAHRTKHATARLSLTATGECTTATPPISADAFGKFGQCRNRWDLFQSYGGDIDDYGGREGIILWEERQRDNSDDIEAERMSWC